MFFLRLPCVTEFFLIVQFSALYEYILLKLVAALEDDIGESLLKIYNVPVS